LDEERCIYIILTKLCSAYSIFVSTFHTTRKYLGTAYKNPSLQSFCDALIIDQDKHVQLVVVIISGTFNKALVDRQKDKSKNPKKQNPHHNNKKNKGLKISHPALASTPNGDRGAKSKSKKTDKHCNFFGKDGHVKSKCFKNI